MRDLTVNGEQICNENVTLLSISYGYSKVTNYEDWLKNSPNPLWYGQDVTYTTADIELLITAAEVSNKNNYIDDLCSKIYSKFQKAIVKEENSLFSIDGHAVSCSEEKINGSGRILNISFEGIKIGERKTVNFTPGPNTLGNNLTLEGNIEIPVRMTINPERSYVVLTLRINGKDYILSNVDENDVIIIDSEQGLILNNVLSYVDHYDSWSLPVFKGGDNSVQCLEGYPIVTLEYNGRWM